MYLCTYTLLKVVSRPNDDLSVLSMSVMGLKKKKVLIDCGWVGGWGELYSFCFGFCLTLQITLDSK